MKYIRIIFGSLVAAGAIVLANNLIAAAIGGGIAGGALSARGSDQPANLFGDTGVFAQISSILLFIVGAVAVIMLIIGGLRYVVSGGDASKVQDAKNTILYALVGIVVAILAYAAVNFVIGSFIPSATNLTGGTGGGATGPYGASTR